MNRTCEKQAELRQRRRAGTELMNRTCEKQAELRQRRRVGT
jgi:hypothetical protein